jgi:DnaK suppressor protein
LFALYREKWYPVSRLAWEEEVAARLGQLRVRLESERKRLNEELEQLIADGQTSERREGSPFGKREEEATESFELEKRLALERRIKEQLADIEYALHKFGTGTYGSCDICGRPIEQGRLEALPEAKLCLSCKAKHARSRPGAT